MAYVWLKRCEMMSISKKISYPDFSPLSEDSTLYPQSLRHQFPHLYVMGNRQLLSHHRALGFCGSRHASAQALNAVRDCAEQAAKNDVIVVSGNASGIDTEAHFSCLNANGKTILVLPEGITHFRVKKQFRPVWDWQRVLVVSQFDPKARWHVARAMQRNQLIIALSQVMLVIEAKKESGGTWDAAEKALKANIPLYAVNYRNDQQARGSFVLLKQKNVKPLRKNKESNKANMKRLFADIQRAAKHRSTEPYHPLFS